MEKPDPIKVLDQPEIHQVLFYPVKMPQSEKSDKRNLFFEVEPGIKIGCRFYISDKKHPTILFFHGNGEVAHDYDDIAPVFNERKVNLLVADYRGYGHSDGFPTIANILNDAGKVFYAAAKMLEDNGYVKKLYIMGRSLGSLCAVEIAQENKKCKGLIVESGSATNFRNYLAISGLIPFDHPVWEEGRNFFNKEKIRRITIPTLIMHAEYDSLIPLSEAKILFDNSGAKNKKLVIIPHADHNTIMFADETLYFNSLMEFIESD
ncbi:MAG: alpha/beta fold hydrolase [Spirochaetes bacterium]|nr:alpha/beta fold hydrolase [Spirochaetota bacterium]